MCMNLSQREPELAPQSIAALGPDVHRFLRACNRTLNGMSVWCGFLSGEFFNLCSSYVDCSAFPDCFILLRITLFFFFLISRLLEEPV